MGKGSGWSDGETVQLWLATSEDPIRTTGQKKASFFDRVYRHWLENKPLETDDPSATAIAGRWKKLQPEVTKYEGIYAKLTSRERSGWSNDMYIENAAKIYAERHKQPFEFLEAWKVLRNKPKWTCKLTTSANSERKRKAGDEQALARSVGQKAAKQIARVGKSATSSDVHMRFVAASEKKADVMEQQLHFNIFMQASDCAESKEYFAMQRKAILAKLRAPVVAENSPNNNSRIENVICSQVGTSPDTPNATEDQRDRENSGNNELDTDTQLQHSAWV